MVCANPDIVVERGDRLIYCAGALARLYAEMGGEAILVGKPHAPIYAAAKKRFAEFGARRILAVGDGLPTDIRGAVDNGVPVLFVTGGIHAADFGPHGDPDGERVAARLHAEGLERGRLYPDARMGGGRALMASATSSSASRHSITLPETWRGGVVAIGNFDGVHRGHQAVLLAARAEAEHLKCPCIMLTFEPHPRAFFSGRPLFRLTPAPLKAALAAALGLDGTLVLDFDRALAEKSAEDFVREMLIGRLGIRAAVTGYDFHFGKARRGTPQFLADQGVLNGFSVTIVEALTEDAAAVSATRIRAALAKGDVDSAAKLLGWHFAVAGKIVHGDKRGAGRSAIRPPT